MAAGGLSDRARAAVLAEVGKADDHGQPALRHARPQEAAAHAPAPNWVTAGHPLGLGDPRRPRPARLRSSSDRPAEPAPVDPAHRAGAALARGLAGARARRAGPGPGRRRAASPLAVEDAGVERRRPRRRAPRRAGPAAWSTGPPRRTSSGSARPTATPGSPTPSPPRSRRRDDPPEVEMLVGSYDVPGARLLDLVAVMDRLRSPGGCPWDAEQTHESLVPYLLEEAHEAVEAIESGDRGAHAPRSSATCCCRSSSTPASPRSTRPTPFDIDDVAGRHRRQAGPAPPPRLRRRRRRHGRRGRAANWEQIKAEEKAGRTSALDGIPAGLPALARADKAASRLHRAGLSALARAGGGRHRRRRAADGPRAGGPRPR